MTPGGAFAFQGADLFAAPLPSDAFVGSSSSSDMRFPLTLAERQLGSLLSVDDEGWPLAYTDLPGMAGAVGSESRSIFHERSLDLALKGATHDIRAAESAAAGDLFETPGRALQFATHCLDADFFHVLRGRFPYLSGENPLKIAFAYRGARGQGGGRKVGFQVLDDPDLQIAQGSGLGVLFSK